MHLRGLALDSLDSWHFFEALLGPEAELTETDLQKLMVATREYSEMLDWRISADVDAPMSHEKKNGPLVV